MILWPIIKNQSFLQAVSRINANPQLLLLEKTLGSVKRSTQTFIMPHVDSASPAKTLEVLAHFLSSDVGRGSQGRSSASGLAANPLPLLAAKLLRHQSIQVTQDHRIRFFPEKTLSGFLEYTVQDHPPDPKLPRGKGNEWRASTYQRQVYGTIAAPFLHQRATGGSLAVFVEPVSFLRSPSNARGVQEGQLVLLEPNLALVHRVLASQKNIKQLRLVHPQLEPGDPQWGSLQQFFASLKDSLEPFAIDTRLAWEGSEVASLGVPGPSLEFPD